MISRPPRMSIRQYMEGMLPCTAPYLLIRVTFSTPTGCFNNVKSSHSRILPQIQQHEVNRVGQAVRDDGCPQIAPGSQKDHAQQRTVNHVLHLAGDALIDVPQPEDKTNQDETDHPGDF